MAIIVMIINMNVKMIFRTNCGKPTSCIRRGGKGDACKGFLFLFDTHFHFSFKQLLIYSFNLWPSIPFYAHSHILRYANCFLMSKYLNLNLKVTRKMLHFHSHFLLFSGAGGSFEPKWRSVKQSSASNTKPSRHSTSKVTKHMQTCKIPLF